jgi:uncharacterized membrane protein HdeD (DUF308 family)
MTSLNRGYNDMQRAIKDALGTNWRLFLVQGAIMIILGVVAVAVPAAATLAVDVFIGWLFLIGGVVGLVAVFSAKDIAAFLWSLIPAVLSVAVGVLLLRKPVEGALSLTIVLTAFFVTEGIFQIVTSIAYRDMIGSSWGWLLLSGIADVALAAIIIYGWPLTAGWALGLLVGINLITSGFALVMAASVGRDAARASGQPGNFPRAG